MKKRWIVGMLCVVLLGATASLQAGAIKDGASDVGQGVVTAAEPVAEDADFAGRSVFWGLGALVAIPFRWLQDAFNAMSQGAANEKFVDHTN